MGNDVQRGPTPQWLPPLSLTTRAKEPVASIATLYGVVKEAAVPWPSIALPRERLPASVFTAPVVTTTVRTRQLPVSAWGFPSTRVVCKSGYQSRVMGGYHQIARTTIARDPTEFTEIPLGLKKVASAPMPSTTGEDVMLPARVATFPVCIDTCLTQLLRVSAWRVEGRVWCNRVGMKNTATAGGLTTRTNVAAASTVTESGPLNFATDPTPSSKPGVPPARVFTGNA